MTASETFLIFLCSGAAKAGDTKLSFRIASKLTAMGIGDIGNLEDLSTQHASTHTDQKRMIFLNDCRSGCVNILTHGFQKDNFIYLDVAPFLTSKEFDIENYIRNEVLPALNNKWNYLISDKIISA
jgi:uncharacterized metal-binding protein